MVGPALFVERLLQEIRLLLEAELSGVGADGSIAGDLVVLDVLSLVDQARVEDVLIRLLLDQLVSFLDQSLHAHALLPARADAEIAANALEALDVRGHGR